MLVAGPQSDRSPPPEEDAPAADSSPAESTADPPSPEHESTVLSLEDRVRRLEDVIAALQLASPEWVEATRDGRPRKEPPSTGITTDPPASTPDLQTDPPPTRPTFLPRQHPWLLTDIYIELRCIPRLFFDPRYHLSWQTLVLAPLLLLAWVMLRMTLGQIVIIGWLNDFVLSPVLLYVLFKVLSREATRYRQTSPDLPLAWRL